MSYRYEVDTVDGNISGDVHHTHSSQRDTVIKGVVFLPVNMDLQQVKYHGSQNSPIRQYYREGEGMKY